MFHRYHIIIRAVIPTISAESSIIEIHNRCYNPLRWWRQLDQHSAKQHFVQKPRSLQPIRSMVHLTERLLKEKAKGCSLHHVKKLNFWGHSLDDISILTSHCPNVEVLSLSVNDISSLEHFGAFPNLRELYLRKNQIRDPQQTRYLSSSRNLRFLWLLENECANHPEYRQIVIANCPYLTKLDDQDVTPMERERARNYHPNSSPNSNQNLNQNANGISSGNSNGNIHQQFDRNLNPQRIERNERIPSSHQTPTRSLTPTAVPTVDRLDRSPGPSQPAQAAVPFHHHHHRATPKMGGNLHQFGSADIPTDRLQVHSDYIPKEMQHVQRPRNQRPTKTESLHLHHHQGNGGSASRGTESSAVEYSYYSHNSKADLPQSTKENLLMAIFALLNELDSDGLVVVSKQLEKLAAHNRWHGELWATNQTKVWVWCVNWFRLYFCGRIEFKLSFLSLRGMWMITWACFVL